MRALAIGRKAAHSWSTGSSPARPSAPATAITAARASSSRSRPSATARGFEAAEILEGHFGDTKLDGLRFVLLYAWPGPVYEGKGEMQAVIDERADAAQRNALLTILTGGETDEAATHWWVFRAMSEKLHEPLFRRIEFSVDIDARVGSVTVPGVIRSTGEPIKSPVNGEPHRVQDRPAERHRVRRRRDRQRRH